MGYPTTIQLSRLTQQIKEPEELVNKVSSWHRMVRGGETTVTQLNDHLRYIAKDAFKIYTRGRDKANYLQTATGRKIINFEDNLENPTFTDLPIEEEKCYLHAMHRKQTMICALSCALRLRKWFLQMEEKEKEDNLNLY